MFFIFRLVSNAKQTLEESLDNAFRGLIGGETVHGKAIDDEGKEYTRHYNKKNDWKIIIRREKLKEEDIRSGREVVETY
jgi:hypothetical protein